MAGYRRLIKTSAAKEIRAIGTRRDRGSVVGRILALDVYKPLKDGKPGKTLLASAGVELTMPLLRDMLDAGFLPADEGVSGDGHAAL